MDQARTKPTARDAHADDLLESLGPADLTSSPIAPSPATPPRAEDLELSVECRLRSGVSCCHAQSLRGSDPKNGLDGKSTLTSIKQSDSGVTIRLTLAFSSADASKQVGACIDSGLDGTGTVSRPAPNSATTTASEPAGLPSGALLRKCLWVEAFRRAARWESSWTLAVSGVFGVAMSDALGPVTGALLGLAIAYAGFVLMAAFDRSRP